jgi:hypothetical protein
MGWADDGYHGTSSDFPEFSLKTYAHALQPLTRLTVNHLTYLLQLHH